jgi:hypothetical protein
MDARPRRYNGSDSVGESEGECTAARRGSEHLLSPTKQTHGLHFGGWTAVRTRYEQQVTAVIRGM